MSQSIKNFADLKLETLASDVLEFLGQSWQKLVISAFIGALIGFANWHFWGGYSSEYVLFNSGSNNAAYAIDLVSWKALQKSLPNLSSQILEENKTPENQVPLYRAMSNEQWWQKNVVPTYALSRADTKELASIGKELEGASTTILNLTLNASGASRDEAIYNVRSASYFLRSGGAYLQIRSLLNALESQSLNAVAELRQKITTAQIEMNYQQERARSLEELLKRFPGGLNSNGQVVDPKDSGAKYLPLSTQIIAANNDINNSKELLGRLQKRLAQNEVVKQFIEKAAPLQNQSFDGLKLSLELKDLEVNMRSKLSKDDVYGHEFLDQLHSQLTVIQVRFTKGLEANTAPIAKKRGMIKATLSGSVISLFIVFAILFAFRFRSILKKPKGE